MRNYEMINQIKHNQFKVRTVWNGYDEQFESVLEHEGKDLLMETHPTCAKAAEQKALDASTQFVV